MFGGHVSLRHSVCCKKNNSWDINITFVKFLALSAGNFSEPWLMSRESAVSTVGVPKENTASAEPIWMLWRNIFGPCRQSNFEISFVGLVAYSYSD